VRGEKKEAKGQRGKGAKGQRGKGAKGQRGKGAIFEIYLKNRPELKFKKHFDKK